MRETVSTKAFTVNPTGIVKLCRNGMDPEKALDILGAMGVPAITLGRDILEGHVDIILEEDGSLSLIDHRETAAVMRCLKGDKNE